MNREKISISFKNSEKNTYEASYLSMIARIVNEGELRCIRGGNVYTSFGEILVANIENIRENVFKFPMLTHRKVFCKSVIEEILWILRGDVDISKLQQKGVHIWDGNASEEFLKSRNLLDKIKPGFLGPMYGYQIRNFNAPFTYIDENAIMRNKKEKLGFDQFASLIQKIKNNPLTRTMLMTTFNPEQVDYGCLYPCTGIVIQFYIDNNNRLHQIMYQRSCDLLIGVPYNVCLYSLLNYIVASLCGLKSGTIKCILADAHVYEYHIPIFNKYFNNQTIELYEPSELFVPKINDIENIDNLEFSDFKCEKYVSSGLKVKYPMFVGSNYRNRDLKSEKRENMFTFANYKNLDKN